MRLADSSPSMQASSNPAGWPLPITTIEAEPSSQDATARAFALPSFAAENRFSTVEAQLHDSRPVIMINTFQLTTTTKLCLALSGFGRMISVSVQLLRAWFPGPAPGVGPAFAKSGFLIMRGQFSLGE
jgi:hypothetical protein